MSLSLGNCSFVGASALSSPWSSADVAGLPHSSDWNVEVSGCPAGVLDGASQSVATTNCALKVTEGDGTNIGTILFFSGGDGTSWYEKQYTGASNPGGWMPLAKARGQRLIQCNWNLTAWGNGSVGPRVLACRGATLINSIYNNATLHTIGRPFICIGHSAGSSVVAYALCHYGLKSIIDRVILTAGPPHSRIDLGAYSHPVLVPYCTTGSNVTYSSGEWNILEVGYGSRTYVRNKTGRGGIDNPLERDSILRVDADLNYPQTDLIAIYGDGDTTGACPLGRYWFDQVTSTATEHITTGSVPHNSVPGSADGNTIIDAALAAATYNH